jgi:hypothetical protein
MPPCRWRREFTLTGVDPSTTTVSSLSWNSESDILAVSLQQLPSISGEPLVDSLQLWHRSNYCWYKKWQRHGVVDPARRFHSSAHWETESPYRLVTLCPEKDATAEHNVVVSVLSFCWDHSVSRGQAGTVAVINGGAGKAVSAVAIVIVPIPRSCGVFTEKRSTGLRSQDVLAGGRLCSCLRSQTVHTLLPFD